MKIIVYRSDDPKFEPIELEVDGDSWKGERKLVDGKLCIDMSKTEGWDWVKGYIFKCMGV